MAILSFLRLLAQLSPFIALYIVPLKLSSAETIVASNGPWKWHKMAPTKNVWVDLTSSTLENEPETNHKLCTIVGCENALKVQWVQV